MAGEQQHLHKRRRYFINTRLQGRFTVCFLILGLFIILGAGIFIWRFSAQECDRFICRSHLSSITPWDVVFPIMMKAIVAAAAVLVPSAYLFAHLVFKRISAKLSSFNGALRDLNQGKLALTNLDEGMLELNEPLKLFAETLKQGIISLQAAQKGMKNVVDRMEKTRDKAALLQDLEGRGRAFAEKLSACRFVAED